MNGVLRVWDLGTGSEVTAYSVRGGASQVRRSEGDHSSKSLDSFPESSFGESLCVVEVDVASGVVVGGGYSGGVYVFGLALFSPS